MVRLKRSVNHPITLTKETAPIFNTVSVETIKGQQIVLLDKDNLKIPDDNTTQSKIYLNKYIFHVNVQYMYWFLTLVLPYRS